MRVFWKLEDILIDVPNATQILAQIVSYLHLRGMISSSGIITQMSTEVRDKLTTVDLFKTHFQGELAKVQEEAEYRLKIKEQLLQFYSNFDKSELNWFLTKQVKERGWELFNHLLIRKAIDYALDKGANEKEACSGLLYELTHKYGFHNRDYGYAFDHLVWNHKGYEIDVPQYQRVLSAFITRAIYDGTVTYRYIVDAEVSDVSV